MTAESLNYPEHPAIIPPDVAQLMGETALSASSEIPPGPSPVETPLLAPPVPQPIKHPNKNKRPTPIVEPHTKAVNEFLAFAEEKGKAELPTDDSQRHEFASFLHSYLGSNAEARHASEKEVWKSQPDKSIAPTAILPTQVEQHLKHYYLETKISSQNEELRLKLTRTRQQYTSVVEEMLPRFPELQQLLLINIGFKVGGPEQAVAYEATQDLVVAYGKTIQAIHKAIHQRGTDRPRPHGFRVN